MRTLVVWFFYINLAALLFSLLGWLVEWLLLAYRRRVRLAWIVTMFASVTLPFAAILWGEQTVLVEGFSAVDDMVAEGLLSLSGEAVSYTADGGYRLESEFDHWIEVFWAGTSGITLLWLGWGLRRLRASREQWLRSASGEEAFFITPSFGPGVMGVLRQRILLPQWILGLDEDDRELIWQHECEHVRAGDNRVLAAALLLLIAVPWILSLWWQFHRLRVAVEIDCDRRVVSTYGDWKRYGELLIRVAEGSTLLPVAPFARRSGPLERRIRSLVPRPPKHRTLRTAGAAVAIPLLLVGWLALPVPAEGENWSLMPLPPAVVRQTLTPPPTEYEDHHRLLNADELRRAVQRRYPESLREQGTEGRVGLLIHVTASGTVDQVRIDQPSAHPEFNRVAKELGFVPRYRPPRRRGSPVDTWLFLRIEFQLHE